MMKLVRATLLLCVLVAAFAVAAQTAEDTENVGIASIVSGEPITRVFEDGVTAHVYAFNATANDVVTISMKQPDDSTLDPFLVLLGARGEVIASDDDGGSSPFLSAEISDVTLPSDGSYLIVASSFAYIDDIIEGEDLEDGLAYEILLEGANPPDGNTDVIEYFSGTLIPGQTFEGFSSLEEPVFFYLFDGNEGDIVDIEMTSDDFDTLLYVVGGSGDRLAVNDDDPQTMTTDSAIRSLVLPATQRYLVFATNVFYYNAGVDDSFLSYEGGTFEITLNVRSS